MYEVPTDTINRQDTQQIDVQPNTPAPIAVYQGNGYQWVTPRGIALIGGGLVTAVMCLFMARNFGSTPESIKVSAPQNSAPSSQEVNNIILENSKASLDTLKDARNIKIEEITQASINERSQEILLEAQRHVTDPKSGCYRSPYGTSCYILNFVDEMERRYTDAILVRQWKKANDAMFDIKSAFTALDGIKQSVPFNPAIPSAAIRKETELRVLILKQSDNSKAAIDRGIAK